VAGAPPPHAEAALLEAMTGVKAAENADVNDDRYNFLIPICLILGTTLLYYLYRYQRNQLEKW
jgi:hypothetical protein